MQLPAAAMWTRTFAEAAALHEGWPDRMAGRTERVTKEEVQKPGRIYRSQIMTNTKEIDLQELAALAQKPSIQRTQMLQALACLVSPGQRQDIVRCGAGSQVMS